MTSSTFARTQASSTSLCSSWMNIVVQPRSPRPCIRSRTRAAKCARRPPKPAKPCSSPNQASREASPAKEIAGSSTVSAETSRRGLTSLTDSPPAPVQELPRPVSWSCTPGFGLSSKLSSLMSSTPDWTKSSGCCFVRFARLDPRPAVAFTSGTQDRSACYGLR